MSKRTQGLLAATALSPRSDSAPFKTADPSSKSKASKGAQLAIGISISLASLSLLLIIFLLFRYRRKRIRRLSIRHDLTSPASTDYTPTTWSNSSQVRLGSVYKQPLQARSKLVQHYDIPVWEGQVRVPVETGLGKGEEQELMELADTSRKSVKEWARSARTTRTRDTRRKLSLVHERSWLDEPTSPDVTVPVRARFE